MKLIAFIQMHNEAERGNLVRCLDNCRQWADDIVIYDDGSTDNSVEVARRYTSHVICGQPNCFVRELFHKQQLLEYALSLNPNWIFWIDCDEIVDRAGTLGGLRALAECAPSETMAFGFREVNLWRSETYARTDGLFTGAWFVRLWRVVPDMKIKTEKGLDRRSYPSHIDSFSESDIKVIHYKFCDYKKLLWGAGLGLLSRNELQSVAKDNFILNENKCACYRVPGEWFPPENIPPDNWSEPKPIPLGDIRAYGELS